MINKLMQYPKAWEKFVEWMLQQAYTFTTKYGLQVFVDEDEGLISQHDKRGLCIEFLDGQRIHVIVSLANDDEWSSIIFVIDDENDMDMNNYPNRQSATEAGIIRAFEILEKQLESPFTPNEKEVANNG